MAVTIIENEPLAKYTSWRIGGPARYFVSTGTPEDVRAALAWAEEVTLVSETHASDEAYAAAAAAFEPKDLVDLTLTIAAMNAFNRLGAPFRVPVKAKP